MPVKIRLSRRGKKRAPIYDILVADSKAPRDGRFIEKIGSYKPTTFPASVELDDVKALKWLMDGAQPTETAKNILQKVWYKTRLGNLLILRKFRKKNLSSRLTTHQTHNKSFFHTCFSHQNKSLLNEDVL